MNDAIADRCREFDSLSRSALSGRLRGGYPVEPGALADCDYLGFSVGMPAIADAILWKRFRKSFRRQDGVVHGWNTRVARGGGERDWTAMTRRGKPATFGRFEAIHFDREAMPFGLPAGVVLDYGARNPRWHPLARMRDPLVALEPDRADVLLGWSYLSLAGRAVPTPSYFLLFCDPSRGHA